MKVELFSFQKKAVAALRARVAAALGAWRSAEIPQVVSLQAPTGAGKTIIMAELMEEIYFGTEEYIDQPEAIFVWLSDSPALNEQSRQKLERVADRIRVSQCVTIEATSFDREVLEDGHIYFLNTQKLGAKGNLSRPSDRRQYTIWQTLENTARRKSDRLYFIIDEAHRGMKEEDARRATTIMQCFLKGYAPGGEHLLSPMPLVIGISATAARFETLVSKHTQSGIATVAVHPDEVRSSGLLKERIIITYPDDVTRNNGWAVLRAATDEWHRKCEHWERYCKAQRHVPVNPIFIIQVESGSAHTTSATDLGELLSRIDDRVTPRLAEHEVVHTFGSTATLNINGIPVHHIEPCDIAEDKRVRIVFFKENLSTGWDCPRAETMLSFCRRQDATYIAQLLGRMIRTPLQRRVLSDDSLNEVRLFLPGFDRDTVSSVVSELHATQGGELPTPIDEELLGHPAAAIWGTRVRKYSMPSDSEQQVLFLGEMTDTEGTRFPAPSASATSASLEPVPAAQPVSAASAPLRVGEAGGVRIPVASQPVQLPLRIDIDRDDVIRFINEQAYLSYMVKRPQSVNYLRSMISIVSLLTRSGVYTEATTQMRSDVLAMIHEHAEALRRSGQYTALAKNILELKLRVAVFDVFGEDAENSTQLKLLADTDAELYRQLRIADAKLGSYGFPEYYGQVFFDAAAPYDYMVDVILFAENEECLAKLNAYARDTFHRLINSKRRLIASKSENYRNQYKEIIAAGAAVSEDNFFLPDTIIAKSDPEGKPYTDHLFVDADTGYARIKLNVWEQDVIAEESRRADFLCWFRNIPRAEGALCYRYTVGNEVKAAYPDFIIVRRETDPASELPYVLDILEPHSPHLSDNLAKAKGLADYADREPRIGRIQLIRKASDPITGKSYLRRLEFSDVQVREKVLRANDNDDLDRIFDSTPKRN